jgi:DNA-binding CsgD family transcriptional regulator
MYQPTASENRQLLSIIGRIEGAKFGKDIRRPLGEDLLRLLGADHFCSYLWDESNKSRANPISINISSCGLRQFEERLQNDDPITPQMQWRRYATEVAEVLPHEKLLRTQLYNDFLRPERMLIGINLFLFDGRRSLGDIRIFRGPGSPEFGKRGVVLLETLKPHLVRAMTNGQRRAAKQPSAPASPRPLPTVDRRRLREDFNLTEREAEVCLMALRGLGDREIAAALGMSIWTARTHLRHIYVKLDVTGRSELGLAVGSRFISFDW